MIQRAPALQTNQPFRILDDGASRVDLTRRREFKFALPYADLGKLRALLTTHCRRIIYHRPVSVVRSIYFDDYELSSCHANIDGIGERRKLRLRWYDQVCPGRQFFFEIKWRKSMTTGKHRYHVLAERPLGEMSYREICTGLDATVPQKIQTVLWKHPDPIVLVEYQREHYVARESDLRITLDYDLKFYDQCGKTAIATRFGQAQHDVVVLEAKTPPSGERHFRRLLFPLTLRPTRCSKYVRGCQMLGLVQMQY